MRGVGEWCEGCKGSNTRPFRHRFNAKLCPGDERGQLNDERRKNKI